MDFIQRTVSLFSRLVQRIKAIGGILSYNYLPANDEKPEAAGNFFWIFNW